MGKAEEQSDPASSSPCEVGISMTRFDPAETTASLPPLRLMAMSTGSDTPASDGAASAPTGAAAPPRLRITVTVLCTMLGSHPPPA